jgi:hypothetical protein
MMLSAFNIEHWQHRIETHNTGENQVIEVVNERMTMEK